MKRCSTLLIVTELQIRTTVKNHLAPVWMAILKQTTNNNGGEGMGTSHAVIENVSWTAQRVLKNKLTQDRHSHSRASTRRETIIWNDTRSPVFPVALFTLSETLKQAKCPLSAIWKKKMWCMYTHTYTHIYIYKIYTHTHTHTYIQTTKGFPGGSAVKNLLAMQETQETRVQSLG